MGKWVFHISRWMGLWSCTPSNDAICHCNWYRKNFHQFKTKDSKKSSIFFHL